MRIHVPLIVLFALAACRSSGSGTPRAKLAQPSGLEQVSIVSKGLE